MPGLRRQGEALCRDRAAEGSCTHRRRVGSSIQSPPGTSAISCWARRRRITRRAVVSPLKTGTSYGYRDAWAIGFDGRMTVGVWVGRPRWRACSGACVGRGTAAPILFEAFARSGSAPRLCRARRRVRFCGERKLPPPLQRFGVTGPWRGGRSTTHHVPARRSAAGNGRRRSALIWLHLR